VVLQYELEDPRSPQSSAQSSEAEAEEVPRRSERKKQKCGDRKGNKKPEGRREITLVSPVGAPLEPKEVAASYRTTCGVLVRDRVPITIEGWRRVD